MQTQVLCCCSKCNICLSFLPCPFLSCIPFSCLLSQICVLTGTCTWSFLLTPYHFIFLIFSLFVPSSDFGQADFKRGIVSMSDLQVGAVLTGRVDNTTLFGAFVDIGVGRSGLIHKSNITLDKLPVSQRRRSLALGPGERVEVRVLNVDPQRGRIGLDLIRVLQ